MRQGHSSDSWKRGDPYEQYVGRWSRRVAPPFLAWLAIPAGRRWLDLGCGTGALSAAILDHCRPASVVGVEPSDGFRIRAEAQLAGRMVFQQGSAGQLPLDHASVDVTVSGLVLNFIPEVQAALAEMVRVTVSGGVIAAYVWDYAGRMEMMRHFWDAAAELDPDAAHLDEGARFPLCHPEALRRLFAGAGFSGVDVTGITIATPFADFDDYWRPFLGGQGPAPAYAMSLDEPARIRLRDRIGERLSRQPDNSILLQARAWAVRAIASR
jgi:SAM-dependent methyltransferase